jgi:hypothetical protein
MMRLFNLSGRKSQTKHHGSPRLYRVFCYTTLGVMIVWGIAALVAVSVDCAPSSYILSPNDARCPDQPLRWRIITIFDVVSELLLIITAITIVWPVQLSASLKVQVVSAFLLRLPLVALSFLRLHFVSQYTTAENTGLSQTPILTLAQVYICWSIISATIPNLKAFVRSFGSGFGIGIDMETYTQAYGSKNSARQKSYEMSNIIDAEKTSTSPTDSRGKATDSGTDHDADEVVTPIRTVSLSTVKFHYPQPPRSSHGEATDLQDKGSIESIRSDKQIIRKDVAWTVNYEASTHAQ